MNKIFEVHLKKTKIHHSNEIWITGWHHAL